MTLLLSAEHEHVFQKEKKNGSLQDTRIFSFTLCDSGGCVNVKNHRDKQLRTRKTTSTCSSSRSLPRRLGHWEHFAGCCHRYDEGELRLLSPGYKRCEQNMQPICFVQN